MTNNHRRENKRMSQGIRQHFSVSSFFSLQAIVRRACQAVRASLRCPQ
jgi:hypothetical protein